MLIHPAFVEALSDIERDFFHRGDALEAGEERDSPELAPFAREASNDNEEDEWEWQIAIARARATTAS